MPAKVVSLPVRTALTSLTLLLGSLSLSASAQTAQPKAGDQGWTDKSKPDPDADDNASKTSASVEDESIQQLSTDLALHLVLDATSSQGADVVEAGPEAGEGSFDGA